MKKNTKVLAWHWTKGRTLRDGRPVPEPGVPLVHDRPVRMCAWGLHASRRILDALKYAPGHMVHRVACRDVVDERHDKLVCRERTILWTMDAEDLIQDFARRCALDVIHLWEAPDVVREYLKTGDEELRAAAGDAAAAAWAAAWAAARAAAAWAAVRDARDAARAARDAAGAARGAAGAARGAAWDRQNRRLTAMVSAARRSRA